jgi:hypothetical protein
LLKLPTRILWRGASLEQQKQKTLLAVCLAETA